MSLKDQYMEKTMQRIYKFRAWDKERNSWLNESDVYKQVENQARWNPEVGKYFILMQYTGLKDKNGVECFEDDILKTPIGIGRMEYDSLTGSYHIAFNGGTNWQIYDLIRRKKVDTKWNCEVIGNVWENPELLEKDNG